MSEDKTSQVIQNTSKALNDLRNIIAEEKKNSSIDKITKPSIVEDVLSFDFSNLDALSNSDMEKYMGALSQYLIYMNKYVNQITISQNAVQRRYDYLLGQKTLENKRAGQTVKEKTLEAESNEEVKELANMLEKFQARTLLYKGIPDSIENLIQTIKKAYDARVKEGKHDNTR